MLPRQVLLEARESRPKLEGRGSNLEPEEDCYFRNPMSVVKGCEEGAISLTLA